MKILVGCDGKKECEKRLIAAYEQAIVFKAEVHLVTSTPLSVEVSPEEIELLERELKNFQKKFTADGINCEIKVLTMGLSAGENLLKYADDHNIDQIVISARKRSKVGKLLMGSTAQHILLEATCNVLVVK